MVVVVFVLRFYNFKYSRRKVNGEFFICINFEFYKKYKLKENWLMSIFCEVFVVIF